MAYSAPLGANDIEAALTVSPQSAATSSQIAFHSPEDLNQIFDAVDSDKSGFIETGEMRACLDHIGLASDPASRKGFLAAMDTDSDGKISRKEFLAFMNSRMEKATCTEATRKLAELKYQKAHATVLAATAVSDDSSAHKALHAVHAPHAALAKHFSSKNMVQELTLAHMRNASMDQAAQQKAVVLGSIQHQKKSMHNPFVVVLSLGLSVSMLIMAVVGLSAGNTTCSALGQPLLAWGLTSMIPYFVKYHVLGNMEHAVQRGGTAALSSVETYASLLQVIQVGGLVCYLYTAKMVMLSGLRTNDVNKLLMAVACPSVFDFGFYATWFVFISLCISLFFGLVACACIFKKGS